MSKNAFQLFQTEVPVPGEGFQWLKSDDGEWFLTSKLLKLPFKQWSIRSIKPIDVQGLYVDFAYLANAHDDGRLTLDRKDVLQFANEYGLLLSLSKNVFTYEGKDLPGEPITRWKDEVFAMREVFELDNILRNGSDDELKKRIKWSSKYESFRCLKHQYSSKELGDETSKLGEPRNIGIAFMDEVKREFPNLNISEENLKPPARLHLQRIINDHLSDSISPFLEFTDNNDLRLQFPLNSLQDILWYQIALSVSGRVDYKQCEVCSELIPIGGDIGYQRSKKTCSDACRKKKSRS